MLISIIYDANVKSPARQFCASGQYDPIQCKSEAARSLLGISQTEFAQASLTLALATRARGLRRLGAKCEAQPRTIWQASKGYLRPAGIIFIDQDEERGPGVRLRKPLP